MVTEKKPQGTMEPLLEKSPETSLEQPLEQVDSLGPVDPLLEMTDLLKRTQANFENYRKQMEKRIVDIKEMAAKDLILQLLPILDNFELALKSISHDQTTDFTKGVELIHAQMSELLHQKGVESMESIGQKFDPHKHEALLKVDSDKPEGIILEEFQRGYLLQNIVIRHAKVKISSGRNPEEHKKTK